MIEREFIKDKIKQMNIRNVINKTSKKSAGIGGIEIEKTPMGERITVHTVRPGMIIGRGGSIIKGLTQTLKDDFKLENPQIETEEIMIASLNARSVAKKIAAELERFGPTRFKGIGYRELNNTLKAGALGAEIIIKGKIPGKRSKTWRFYGGYMKKRGNISDEYLDCGKEIAILRSGTVGINVIIMHEDTPLPDRYKISEPVEEPKVILEEIKEPEPEIKKKEVEPNTEKTEAKKSVAEQSYAKTPAKADVKPEKGDGKR